MPIPFAAIPAAIQAGSSIYNMFQGNKQQKRAMGYLNQVNGIAKDNYSPFIEQGREAQGQLSPLYEQMMQNPTGYLNQLMGGYNQSPWFQQQMESTLKGLSNTAASGGLAGTNQVRADQGNIATQLQGEDMQRYLQQILGLQGAGIQGLEGAVGRGERASDNYASTLSGLRNSQSSMSYMGGGNPFMKNLMGAGNAFGRFGGAMGWQNLGDMFK